jgi:hypothetical protein
MDKRPQLPAICRGLGIQLWMPGASARARRYTEALLSLSPELHVVGGLGPDGPFGFEWVDVPTWRSEPAFHVRGVPVTRDQFVKFVRNKLGGGHFDETNRTQWQRDLLAVTEGLKLLDQEALAFQMKAITTELALAVDVSRLRTVLSSLPRPT